MPLVAMTMYSTHVSQHAPVLMPIRGKLNEHQYPEEVGHPSSVTWQWNVWLQCLPRLLTFNLSLDFSIAMVPVVDLLLYSLASSHYFLVIANIVSCYRRRQLICVNPPRLLSIVAYVH